MLPWCNWCTPDPITQIFRSSIQLLNFYGKFREEVLKDKVSKAVVIKNDIIAYLFEKEPEVVIQKLEEYGTCLLIFLLGFVVNSDKDKKLDFAEIKLFKEKNKYITNLNN